MSTITDQLGHKIGPLPVGAWALAVGGGLGIAVLIRNRSTSSAGPGVAEPLTAESDGLGGASVSDPANPGNVSGPIADDGEATATAITTNNEWRVQAVKYAIGKGNGALAAQNAVSRYLAGKPLSPAYAGIIRDVIAGIGPTPSAVGDVTITHPKPAPKPKPKPKPKPAPKPHKMKDPRPHVHTHADHHPYDRRLHYNHPHSQHHQHESHAHGGTSGARRDTGKS